MGYHGHIQVDLLYVGTYCIFTYDRLGNNPEEPELLASNGSYVDIKAISKIFTRRQ